MKLTDTFDPAVTKFLYQCYEEETKQRVAWNNKYPDLVQKAVDYAHDTKNYAVTDPLKRSIEMQLPAFISGYEASAHHRFVKPCKDYTYIHGIKYLRHDNTIVKLGLGDPKDDPRLERPDTDPTFDPIMRFMNPKVRRILYKFPPPKREIYLKERYKLLPEERYYFPETTAMEYGWRMNNKDPLPGPKYGLPTGTLATTRVGLQRDPPHYQEIPPKFHMKCTPT